MQRQIEQPDRHRPPAHDAKQLDEIAPEHRPDPLKDRAPVLGVIGKDHLAHRQQAVFGEKHVLGAAQPDPLGLEHLRLAGVFRGVGIGAHADIARRVGPGQQGAKALAQRRGQHRRGAGDHLAVAAVERDHLALAQHPPAGGGERARFQIEREVGRADDAGHPEPARDHRRVTGHAAAHRQHRLGHVHAANILGRGLAPHQHAGLVLGRHRLRRARGEHDPAGGGPRRGGDARADHVARAGAVNLAVQKLRERPGRHPQHRFVLRDDPVFRQRHGDAQVGARAARHAHGVEDVEPLVLDGELDLHLLAQPLAGELAIAHQIVPDLRQHALDRAPARVVFEIENIAVAILGGERVAALRLAHVAAPDLGRAGGGVDKLDHPRAGNTLAHAQRHLLHHEAKAGIGRRALCLAQQPCGSALPGARHRAQHLAKLLAHILGKRLVGLGFVGRQRAGERLGGGQPGGFELVGVGARHMHRVRLDEAQIQRVRRRLAVAEDKLGVQRFVHTDVEDRPRPAPVGIFRRGPHRQQRFGAEIGQHRVEIGHVAGRQPMHRTEIQHHRRRHRHVKPDQPLQAFGPPTMARRRDRRGGGDLGKAGDLGQA